MRRLLSTFLVLLCLTAIGASQEPAKPTTKALLPTLLELVR